MSAVGLMAAVCDACGVHGPAATDLTAARVASTTAGWALSRVDGQVTDLCPRHVGRTPSAATYPPPPMWVCHECANEHHDECAGWAWDFNADEKTQCQCPRCSGDDEATGGNLPLLHDVLGLRYLFVDGDVVRRVAERAYALAWTRARSLVAAESYDADMVLGVLDDDPDAELQEHEELELNPFAEKAVRL
jgi:hypothetical protein